MTRIPTWFPILLAVVVIVGLSPAGLAEDVLYLVKEVGQDFLTLTSDNKDITFTVAKDAKVTIAGKEAKLADIKRGTKASVRYVKDGNKLVVTEVKAW